MKAILGLRGRRLAIATVAIFAAAAGIAYAAIPDSGGVFHACMLKNIGTIRIIDPSTQHCVAALETEITFNQKGQKGDPGSPGAQGQPGANGANGVSPTVTQLAAGDPNCPAGGAAITDASGTTAYACSGANGSDGQPFSGTFTSPNGQYSIAVTDTGVTIAGPGGSTISMAGNDIKVHSSGTAELQSALGMDLRGSTDVRVESGTDLLLRSGTDATLQGGTQATVKGGAAVTLQSSGSATVSGSNTTVSGAGFLGLSGGLVAVNAGGGCLPAARLTDPVVQDVIAGGSSSVCIGG